MDFADIVANSQAREYVKSELATCEWDYLFVYEDALSYIPNEYSAIWNDESGFYIYKKVIYRFLGVVLPYF